jgi:hypothetical protein
MNCVKNQIKNDFFKALLNNDLVDTGCCILPLQKNVYYFILL